MLCFLSGHNMVKDITVVETNYNEYALVLKNKVFNREYTQVALYGEAQTHTYTHCLHYTCDQQLHCRADTVHHHSVCLCVFPYLCAGRAQRVRIDIIQKFKAFALSQGFSRESILTPPPAGKVYSTYTCI